MASSSGGSSRPTVPYEANAFCDRLGITPPRIVEIPQSRDCTCLDLLLVVALLERG